jgi:hypothetical protein
VIVHSGSIAGTIDTVSMILAIVGILISDTLSPTL